MNSRKQLMGAMLAAALALAVTACEREGPVERTGEEIDEAVDTMKEGGEESTQNKVDDAVDEAREGAEDTAEELDRERR